MRMPGCSVTVRTQTIVWQRDRETSHTTEAGALVIDDIFAVRADKSGRAVGVQISDRCRIRVPANDFIGTLLVLRRLAEGSVADYGRGFFRPET
jgi:hypothetical protein